MEDQEDEHNERRLEGGGAGEVFAYFGCWLDVNQDVERFPVAPNAGDNGPFDPDDYPNGLKSIQELMRGLHQCLVAEIDYDLDPTINGATPGSSDNLAQRNILFDDSDNPGSFAAHLVHHTFELKPSPVTFEQWELAVQTGSTSAAGRLHPDELVIEWGELPRDSLVTFYMPQVDAAAIVRANARRQSPGNLAATASDTIRCRVTDVGFIPIPGGITRTIAGLLSVQLPPGVPAGAEYTVTLRQVAGRSLRVLGTTEFRIRVGQAAQLLPGKLHDLSVLRHIALAIPSGNRWERIFARYLGELEDRVRAFGGDPDAAPASPTGNPGGRDEPTEDDVEVCVSGRVRRLFYDCMGDFEGFEVQRCEGVVRIHSCDPGVERVALTACERRLRITVHRERGEVKRMMLGCCSCSGCAEDVLRPVPARPTPVARPEPPRRVRPRYRLDEGRGPVDPGHGAGQHGSTPTPPPAGHDHGHGGHDHGGAKGHPPRTPRRRKR